MCKGTGKFSVACASNIDLVSSENPTPSLASDPDLLNEQAILCKFLDTIDSDDDVVVSSASVYSVFSNCKHPPIKGEDFKGMLLSYKFLLV